VPVKNKPPSQNQLDSIKIMHNKGLSNRDIGSVLSLHHKTVGKHLKLLGFDSNNMNQPIDKVSATEARCSKCNDIKPINEFQKGRKGSAKEYTFSYCNLCRKKQTYLNLNSDVRLFLNDRFNRLKKRCQKENIVCTITKEQFLKQFFKQDGLCFYTDAVMICEVGNNLQRDSMSIDKLIPEKGYINGNVVFTTHRINTCKADLSLDELSKWMPSFHERIQQFLRSTMKINCKVRDAQTNEIFDTEYDDVSKTHQVTDPHYYNYSSKEITDLCGPINSEETIHGRTYTVQRDSHTHRVVSVFTKDKPYDYHSFASEIDYEKFLKGQS
jgi:hypothetical protein